MPSAISLSTSIIPDFKEIRSRSFSLPKSPKAAKRFFGKSEDSPPVPPLPSATTTPHHQHTPSSSSISSTASIGFSGATVVRTPQEALEGIKSLTPPVLPQLPIAHTYSSPNGRKPPIYLYTHTNSLDRGRANGTVNGFQSTTGGLPKIHRSQSATEELRSPISSSSPATPATAPPCRGGIIGVKGVLKSPSHDYLRGNDVSADKWAREVLGSIRISTDNHNDALGIISDLTGKMDMDLGEGEELNSFINSYGTKLDSFQPTPSSLGPGPGPVPPSAVSTTSLTSVQTFGHDERFKGYQPSIVSTSDNGTATASQGYTEDQYKPYSQPGSSTTNNSMLMLDEGAYPPRSTSTLQHLEEVKFTPYPPPSGSIISSTTKEEDEYDDVEYDPFKKIDHYPSSTRSSSSRSSSSTSTTKRQRTNLPIQAPTPVPFTTPTYPKANPVESTYSPRSKPKQLVKVEEDKSFLMALPTRDFTRSPSTHSMHPPSPTPTPVSATSKNSPAQSHGHMRCPSTPSPLPSSSSMQRTIIQTHTRSPSSPAEFSPSPLSPSPNAPIQRLRRPSLLSNRSTVRPTPPARTTLNQRRYSAIQTPFHATILEDKVRVLPDGQDDLVLLNFEFAYSLDDKPINEKVILPIEVIRQQGQSKLLDWIERYLSRVSGNSKKVISTVTTIPEMTDGESAEESDLESDNGLTALLRDEYLNSFLLPDPPSTATSLTTPNPNPTPSTLELEPSSPSAMNIKSPLPPDLPLPPTPASTLNVLDDLPTRPSSGDSQKREKEGWKRGVTPRQYEQLQSIYPTPLSSLAPTSQDDDDTPGEGNGHPEMAEVEVDEVVKRELDRDDKTSWMPPKTPPLSIRRHSKSHLPPTPTSTIPLKPLQEREEEQGKLRELRIFLTREAGAWHRIAHRLLSGRWGDMRDEIYRQRVIDELDWVGLIPLREELAHRDQSQDIVSPLEVTGSLPPVSIGGIISNKFTSSTEPTSTQKALHSAGFIGFTPLSGNSSPLSMGGVGGGKKIQRSSSSTSLMMLRSKGSRVSGVSRGGSGYI
ncbi:hypothetical protein I302_101414 [Kwoniella bestiolae CBS 10118]|uniref:Uncharacterized protein n=1 Tax=Kwoniella bestiolae CBS 10118 TaxID=1296100 RepID=A0A1B9GC60_9TREE|nr:hypothetical protein I302_00096 [Kwoniella bestiolae CBS 10118]OCF28608.1 hypothetical protein I302_00096 [Kwoniella bestiolae CBS 10118]